MLMSLLVSLFIGSAPATSATQPTIPDGQYEGKAKWKDSAGRTGTYTVSTLVQAGVVMTTYSYGKGKVIYAFRSDEVANGFVDVHVNGKKVGEGYCMSVQCNYNAEINGVILDESLTFWQGNLYRVGSKKVQGLTIAWEEAMKKVK